MSRIAKITEYFNKAHSDRQVHESDWGSAFDYTFPERNSVLSQYYTGLYENSKRDRIHLYDSTAMTGVNDLSAAIQGLMTPFNEPWLSYQVEPEFENRVSSDTKRRIDKYNAIIRDELEKSRFDLASHEALQDAIVAGNGGLGLYDDDECIKAYSIPIGEMYWCENVGGQIDTIFRRHALKAKDIILRWGSDPEYNIPPDVIKAAKEAPNTDYTVLQSCYPYEKGRYFYSVMICEGFDVAKNFTADKASEIYFKETTFDDIPFLGFRWNLIAGQSYGDSPILQALPDIKMLNELKKDIAKFTEYAAFGIWYMLSDGFKSEQLRGKMKAGAVIPLDEEPRPFPFPGDMQSAYQLLQLITNQIKELIFSNELPPMDRNSYMTAEEVMARRSAFLRKVGQPVLRLQKEFLEVFGRKFVRRLQARGKLPEFSGEELYYSLKVNSAAALSRKQSEVINEIQIMAQAMQTVGPEVVFKAIDMNKFAKKIFEDSGFSHDLFRSEEEIQQMEEDEQQQQQITQAAQLFSQFGGRRQG